MMHKHTTHSTHKSKPFTKSLNKHRNFQRASQVNGFRINYYNDKNGNGNGDSNYYNKNGNLYNQRRTTRINWEERRRLLMPLLEPDRLKEYIIQLKHEIKHPQITDELMIHDITMLGVIGDPSVLFFLREIERKEKREEIKIVISKAIAAINQ